MSKRDFVQIAPSFYAVAILEFLMTRSPEAMISELTDHYSEWDDNENQNVSFLNRTPLIEASLNLLKEAGFIDVSQAI